MKLTKVMGLAVVLVALAAVMNALAYKTAVVTNGLSMTVDTTSASKLALDAATVQDPGVAATITNGKLSLSVSDKMQPDSIYTYESALKITNNDAVNAVVITYVANGLTGGVTVNLLDASNVEMAGSSIPASGTVQVKLKVTVPANFVVGGGTLAALQSGSLVITGTR